MHKFQLLFKTVQKDINNDITQIKEKWLHWIKDILTHYSFKYYKQSFEVDHNLKIKW